MNNYKYVTLLTSDNYVQGVILLKESLRRVKSQYSLLCLVNDSLSEDTMKILEKAKIEYQVVENIPVSQRIYEHNKKISTKMSEIWKDVFTKFHVWNLTQYDKVIFIDADILILKNLDHCFEYEELTAAYDGEYFNLWPQDFHFNSGFMVVKPDENVFKALFGFVSALAPDLLPDYRGKQRVIADQDILNEYFKENWTTNKEHILDKYYNIFAPYIFKEYESDVMTNGNFIHFVGIKPWFLDEEDKAQITHVNIAPRLSLLPYELAYGIVNYSYMLDFENIDWEGNLDGFYVNMSNICKEIFDDMEHAKYYLNKVKNKTFVKNYASLEDNISIKNKCENYREAIKQLLLSIYKEQIITNAYVHDILNSIDAGDDAVLYSMIELIENAFKEKFKQF